MEKRYYVPEGAIMPKEYTEKRNKQTDETISKMEAEFVAVHKLARACGFVEGVLVSIGAVAIGGVVNIIIKRNKK